MTRSALIVGAALAGLLLQSGLQPAGAEAKAGNARTLFGQSSESPALYTRDRALSPSVARAAGGDITPRLFALGTTPVLT